MDVGGKLQKEGGEPVESTFSKKGQNNGFLSYMAKMRTFVDLKRQNFIGKIGQHLLVAENPR